MSFIYAFTASVLFGCSIYMILSRNLVRMILGLSLLATTTNLILFQTGRTGSRMPPLIPKDATRIVDSADPVPQALVLTAIVIGFALTLVLAALALRAWRDIGTIDSRRLDIAEAPDDPDPRGEP